MKKTIALLLAVMLVVSMAPAAFASTTTLTTTVPGATYEFSIPADTTIEYNATCTSIGYVHVTESSGFAVGKNLEITMEYGPFINISNPESTISYKICADDTAKIDDTATYSTHNYTRLSGSSFVFRGLNNGQVERLAYQTYSNSTTYYYGDLAVHIEKEAWGKTLGGDYTSTITFTAAVVQD